MASNSKSQTAEKWESRPWQAQHGDTVCDDCGGANPVWWVDTKLWFTVVGGHAGILCPACFISKAEDMGIGTSGAWQLYPPARL